jgi:hypothetical protein
VNDISFDASGGFVATASEDGTVAVRGSVVQASRASVPLTAPRRAAAQVASVSGEEHTMYDYHKPVKARLPPRARSRNSATR